LSNVGDHAQAVAIGRWIQKWFPDAPVLELDKFQTRRMIPALKWLVGPEDLFLLHSGGNLGDRGIWSENARRCIIRNFPNNRIVSLPQTIFFSDTPQGRRERARSRRIYGRHPNLTVIGRDSQSGNLAAELFPRARTLCLPDFVLSLPPRPQGKRPKPSEALLCLRRDDESILTEADRRRLAEELPFQCEFFDTTLPEPIDVDRRADVLESVLDRFQDSDLVVTDRYHGLVFAVLCRKPCVVLRTVDHKMTSAMEWFCDVRFVRFAEEIGAVPEVAAQCMAETCRDVPDWNAEYFDRLPRQIGLRAPGA